MDWIFVLAVIFSVEYIISAEDKTKIVGGREVDVTLAPFIAELMYKGRHLCGCSIITHNFVLTVSGIQLVFSNYDANRWKI